MCDLPEGALITILVNILSNQPLAHHPPSQTPSPPTKPQLPLSSPSLSVASPRDKRSATRQPRSNRKRKNRRSRGQREEERTRRAPRPKQRHRAANIHPSIHPLLTQQQQHPSRPHIAHGLSRPARIGRMYYLPTPPVRRNPPNSPRRPPIPARKHTPPHRLQPIELAPPVVQSPDARRPDRIGRLKARDAGNRMGTRQRETKGARGRDGGRVCPGRAAETGSRRGGLFRPCGAGGVEVWRGRRVASGRGRGSGRG